MKCKNLGALLCFIILATACSSGSSYWIDNPTDSPITVAIDETSYTIPPVTMLEVDVEYGKHQLKYNGEELTFHNGGRTNNSQGIINPTQSTYIFYKQIFMNKDDERATDEYAQWALRTQSDSVTLSLNDSIVTLFLPFKASNSVFILKTDFDWKLTLGEPMPETVMLTSPLVTRSNRKLLNDENYKAGKFQDTLYKIYREEEFDKYLKKTSDDRVDFLLVKKTYKDLPRFKIELTKMKDIVDQTYAEELHKEIKRCNDWLDLKGSSSASEFKEVFFSNPSLEKTKARYLEEHPKDYSFNEAVRELESQKTKLMRYQLNIVD